VTSHGLCGAESVDERDARERDTGRALHPCHGWSPRSPIHTCSALGVRGEHGVRGRVGEAAEYKRVADGGAKLCRVHAESGGLSVRGERDGMGE